MKRLIPHSIEMSMGKILPFFAEMSPSRLRESASVGESSEGRAKNLLVLARSPPWAKLDGKLSFMASFFDDSLVQTPVELDCFHKGETGRSGKVPE